MMGYIKPFTFNYIAYFKLIFLYQFTVAECEEQPYANPMGRMKTNAGGAD